MKKQLMLCLVATIVASVVFAQAPQCPKGKGQPGQRPPMTSLLPPPLVEKLQLTADQKAKLDQAYTDFKTANPTWEADMKKAHEDKDQATMQRLHGIRKAAVDQWATCLTAEQKATMEEAHKQHQGHQGGPGAHQGHKGGQQGPPPQE